MPDNLKQPGELTAAALPCPAIFLFVIPAFSCCNWFRGRVQGLSARLRQCAPQATAQSRALELHHPRAIAYLLALALPHAAAVHEAVAAATLLLRAALLPHSGLCHQALHPGFKTVRLSWVQRYHYNTRQQRLGAGVHRLVRLSDCRRCFCARVGGGGAWTCPPPTAKRTWSPPPQLASR